MKKIKGPSKARVYLFKHFTFSVMDSVRQLNHKENKMAQSKMKNMKENLC
jgi:hypothetical protein